ncbi:hypothetical protein EAF04_008607 [Stromatinia cepivora]|nr:hypothetical protein EAF04_008607 [Stromatinia cepivora]
MVSISIYNPSCNFRTGLQPTINFCSPNQYGFHINLQSTIISIHPTSVASVPAYNPPSSIATTLSSSVVPAVTLPTTLLSSVIGSSTGSTCSTPCASTTTIVSCSASIYPLPSSSGASPSCSTGDVLFDIAKDNGVTLADLETANPEVTDHELIQPGLAINLQPPTFTPAPTAPSTSDPCATQAVKTVTVKLGDTLTSIAAANGITVAALEAADPNIIRVNSLYPGAYPKTYTTKRMRAQSQFGTSTWSH